MLCKTVFLKMSQNSYSSENTFFMEYLLAAASNKYSPEEKLFKKSFKNSGENTRERV